MEAARASSCWRRMLSALPRSLRTCRLHPVSHDIRFVARPPNFDPQLSVDGVVHVRVERQRDLAEESAVWLEHIEGRRLLPHATRPGVAARALRPGIRDRGNVATNPDPALRIRAQL